MNKLIQIYNKYYKINSKSYQQKMNIKLINNSNTKLNKTVNYNS